MRKAALLGAMALALLPSLAMAQMAPETDADFVKMASVGNTFEIEEAKLALERSTDAGLKTFAQHMIDDHGDAMKKLEAAASKSGNKAAMMLDAPHQAMLDNLKTFNGTDFDKIYKADQIAAHAETVALVADYVQNGKNDDLHSWAKNTLPVVKQHMADVDAL